MIATRFSKERGHATQGWLDSYHTFSFADYYDPERMKFRDLRVINEDWIAPGQGFGTHPHHDMEILTYVIAGALEHRDSMGNGAVLRAGDVQVMTAGRGITHSEFNHSKSEAVHLTQIWIAPRAKGLTPQYADKSFGAEPHGALQLIASPDASDQSLPIGQDARVYILRLEAGKSVTHRLIPGRYAWVQILQGSAEVNKNSLRVGDGAAISDEAELAFSTPKGVEALVFDLS